MPYTALNTRRTTVLTLSIGAVCALGAMLALAPQRATETSPMRTSPGLTIDLPNRMTACNVVLFATALDRGVALPAALSTPQDLMTAFSQNQIKAQVVLVLDDDALAIALGDEAWKGRGLEGNPWKSTIATLQQQGLSIVACGNALAEMNRVNADLLPGVKVATRGELHFLWLKQQGFSAFPVVAGLR